MKEILLKICDAIQQTSFNIACTMVGNQISHDEVCKQLDEVRSLLNSDKNVQGSDTTESEQSGEAGNKNDSQ